MYNKPLRIDESYLKYCEDDRELDIIRHRIELGTNRKVAASTSYSKSVVDRIVRNVYLRKMAGLETEGNPEKPLPIQNAEEMKSQYFIKGTSTLYDPEGNVKLQWVKTQVDQEIKHQLMKEAIQELISELKEVGTLDIKISHELSRKIHEEIEDDILTVYPIGDLHLGMFSWEEETGDNYDIKEACNLLTKAFDRMMLSAPNSSEAILANLGDFFHIDDTRNETMRSANRLDADTRYPKILKVGLELITGIVAKLLLKHEKVIIRNAIGNHDPHTSIFLSEYIAAWFHEYVDSGRLVIEDAYKTFWFYKFGKNLIGITHGDTCKMDALPEVMAYDAKEYWGDTDFRHWYIGHIHHSSKKEFRTCSVESFGTLAAKDAWHSSSGYRSQRQIKFKVLHKDFGEIQEGTVNLAMLEK